jgi:hypothetical protein
MEGVATVESTASIMPSGDWVSKEAMEEAVASARELAQLEREQAIREWKKLLVDIRAWAKTAETARQVYKDDLLFMEFTDVQNGIAATQQRILRKLEEIMVARMEATSIKE